MAHEVFTREYAIKSSGNRQFGLVVGGLLMAVGALKLVLASYIGPFSATMLLIGGGLVICALTRPQYLSALNSGWQRFGLLLHRVTNPIFLGAIFVLAFVPVGLCMRLFGADMLSRSRRNRDFWVSREKTGSTVESLKQPF